MKPEEQKDGATNYRNDGLNHDLDRQRVLTGVRFLARFRGGGSFESSVLILIAGSVLAQGVSLAAAPLLARLYTPAEFGSFSVFFAFCSILALVITGRYELAILLPREPRSAFALLVGAVALAITGGVVSLVVLQLLVVEMHNGVIVAMTMAVMVSSTGIYQSLSYWLNRQSAYPQMAAADLILKGTTEVAKLVMASEVCRRFVSSGLIAGAVLGQVISTVIISIICVCQMQLTFPRTTITSVIDVLKEYKRFPIFNLPYSLIVSVSNDLLVLLFSAFNYLEQAGFVGLTRRLVVSPISLLSSSIGRVYFRELASGFGTPRVEELTMRLMGKVADIFTPPVTIFVFLAPEVFEALLGENWREAGLYASAMSPIAFCSLFTSWPERVYEVAGKQNISLSLQVGFDLVRVITLVLLLRCGVAPFACVVINSAVMCGFHVCYLIELFRIAGFPLAKLAQIFVSVVRKIVGFCFCGILVSFALDGLVWKMVILVCVCLVYYLRLARRDYCEEV